MEARSFSLAMLLKCDEYYEIPYFQRPFVWDDDNWSEFLTSLSDLNKTHFLGSIVLKPTKVLSGEKKRYCVIDGQQRLTTFSLLVRACYDALESKTEDDYYDFRELLFVKEFTGERKPQIQHSYFDREVYEKIIQAKETNSSDKKSLIYKCYNYFLKEMKNRGDEKIRRFFSEVLSNTSLQMFVKVDLKEEDNEQEIFDVINSTGVKLTSADIIKNSLFQKANDVANALSNAKAVVEKMYMENWHDVFYGDKELEEFWSDKIMVRSIERSNLEMFLHAFACIKDVYDPEKHRISELASCYKQKILDYNSINQLKDFLNDIKDYAHFYKVLFEIDKNESYSYKDGLKRLLHIIITTNTTTFRSYILKLVHDEGTTDFTKLSPKTKQALYDIEVLLVRGLITKSNVSKNYNKFTRELLLGAYPTSHLLEGDRGIDNELMSVSLKNVTNANATLLLYWIELYRRRDDKNDVNELKYNFTLEHIMPKKWSECWRDVPVYKDFTSIENHPDYKVQVRVNAILHLGNMTLLKSKLNTSIQNNTFAEKLKGIKKYSELTVSKEIFKNTKWDERDIYERTNALAKEICEIWKLPKKVSNQQPTSIQTEFALGDVFTSETVSPIEITNKKEAIEFLSAIEGLNVPSKATYAGRMDWDFFWITPQKNVLDSKWSLILNNRRNREIILLLVPSKTFKIGNKEGKELKVSKLRGDVPDKLRIRIDGETLIDRCSKCNFSPFVIQRVRY